MANALYRPFHKPLLLPPMDLLVPTKTGLALGSVYVYATSGAAWGYRFISPVSSNLNDVYFFVSATAGTPGVTTVELRNNISGTVNKPGTTLHATQTVSPGTTANKWIKCTFGTPYSCVQGNEYWIVIGDAGWTTGNTATVVVKGGFANYAGDTASARTITGYTTADGFTTAGSSQTSAGSSVLKFADGTIIGAPYTTNAAHGSSALERGLKIVGLTEKLVVIGAIYNVVGNLATTFRIYSGATAPGGTTGFAKTLSTGEKDAGCVMFAPFTLLKDTIYRVTLSAGATTLTCPGYYQIEDFATSTDLTDCSPGGGRMHETIDNGAGGWTDNIDLLPKIALIVTDQVAINVQFAVGNP
jgi:hypothetical protein